MEAQLPDKRLTRVRIPHILPWKGKNAKTRLGASRKWLKAGAAHLSGCRQFGGPQRRKPRGPWRSAARLGSPHLEPARLTVGNAPTRFARRVQCRTLKKAVMGVYRRAVLRSGGGGHPGNGVGHGARYTRKRTLGRRRSLNRLCFLGKLVAMLRRHPTGLEPLRQLHHPVYIPAAWPRYRCDDVLSSRAWSRPTIFRRQFEIRSRA